MYSVHLPMYNIHRYLYVICKYNFDLKDNIVRNIRIRKSYLKYGCIYYSRDRHVQTHNFDLRADFDSHVFYRSVRFYYVERKRNGLPRLWTIMQIAWYINIVIFLSYAIFRATDTNRPRTIPVIKRTGIYIFYYK